MAAMSTLRSLCMVRVHQLNFPASLLTTKYLPESLARDVAKASLFQGNFMLKEREISSERCSLVEVALTISYDGANWIFSHRSQDVLLSPQFCCEACDVNRPDLVTVVMQEGITHPTFLSEIPFDLNLEWLKPEGSGPEIKLSVEIDEDGATGKLVFKGCGFNKVFEMCFQNEARTLMIRNTRNSENALHLQLFNWAPVNFVRWLSAVEVTAEMAFPEPQNRTCSNQDPWNNDTDSEDNDWGGAFGAGLWGAYDPEDEDSDPEEPGSEIL